MSVASRKLSRMRQVFQEDGVLGICILGLQFIQKKTRSPLRNTSSGRIHTVARYDDILHANLDSPPSQKWNGQKKSFHFAWIMPPPGKGSGGHMNMFRFIDFLEKSGHTCSIYIYVNGEHGTIEDIVSSMGDSYPNIKAGGHAMKWLETNMDLPGDIDGIFCSSWETAYASYRLRSSAKRFYFVQDFEPYFYPIGGLYALAENTYKMGFTATTAGGWLAHKLKKDYGMKARSFDFGADKSIYRHVNFEKRNQVFYYARPYTSRRGFEMGILALDLFHKKHPDCQITIVGWDVSDYDIPFPYVNKKIMEIDQLSDLYNQCAAGLVLSYTNMSLLPLELLSCGTIPVVNEGENNRLVADNPFIAYTDSTPHALANKLSAIIERRDQSEYAKRASDSVPDDSWQASGDTFVNIIEEEMRSGK